MSSSGETPPTPEEQDATPEGVEEADAMQYPGHENPDVMRERVGLKDEGRPEPEGAPRPQNPDRSAPRPGEHASD